MKNNNEQDLKIIKSILEGDYSKFEILMNKYQKFVFYRAFREFRNQEEAEDLTQDIFLRVFENLSNFRAESKFSSWLFIITKNAIIEKKRKLSRRYTESLDEDQKSNSVFQKNLFGQFLETVTPETQFLKKELYSRLKQLLEKLPTAYQKPIFYHYFQNLSYKEISDKLDMKINTIKSNVLRGKKIMYQWLMEENGAR